MRETTSVFIRYQTHKGITVVSEADTRANYIDPALKAANWQSSNILGEHYFTDGRKLAGGARGRRCFVDYLLLKDNRYLAVVEAKKEE